MNLIDKIPERDKEKIERYVSYYGGANGEFIGVDEWLEPWNNSKKKLYKLLGNNLIYSTPFSYEVTKNVLKDEIQNLLLNVVDMKNEYESKLYRELYCKNIITHDNYYDLKTLFFNTNSWVEDKINFNFKVKIEKSSIQLQKGMKPIRALGKIIKWYRETFNDNSFCKDFENFRINHSKIFNNNVINTKLVLSIHPMDYITMSDNANNWTSCMNWMHSGCYHAGTVEMMNSNVVICAYLESDSYELSFVYDKDENDIDTVDFWNSKKWRQLIYVNKDIILAGKSYPTENETLTKKVIELVKDLAKTNMNWIYDYGPELYKDMLSVNSIAGMSRARKMRYNGNKKAIYIDTKSMYNDMFNCNDFDYWCYRNTVKKSYVLGVSGKSLCVRCGNILNGLEEDYCESYNDRYDASKTVCQDCLDEVECRYCDTSDGMIGREKLITITNLSDENIKICKEHFNCYIKRCPCCNEPMKIKYRKEDFYYILKNTFASKKEVINENFFNSYETAQLEKENAELLKKLYNENNFIPIYLCNKCISEYNTLKKIKVKSNYRSRNYYYHIIDNFGEISDDFIKEYCFIDNDNNTFDNNYIKENNFNIKINCYNFDNFY